MGWLAPYLAFVHVVAVVLAFGPTYAYGIGAGLAEHEPMHIGFNNRVRELTARRFTVPGTIIVGLTGAGLMAVTGYPWLSPASRWLQAGILLYAGAIAYTVLVTWPVQRRMAAVGARLAAERAAAAAASAAAAPSAPATTPPAPSTAASPAGPSRPSGPPAELAPYIHRVRRDGKIMGVIVLVVVFLMVVKPAFPL
jgi:hypothetical protein